jgi:hypothetical protein
VFSGVFIAAEVYGVGVRRLPQWFMYRHSQRPFFEMSMMCACFIDAAFFFKKKASPPWDSSPQMSYYQDIGITWMSD